jgi:hypothetical protein
VPSDENTNSDTRVIRIIIDTQQTSEVHLAIFERFKELHQERAGQLAAAQSRLRAQLGEEHESVVMLSRTAGMVATLATSLQEVTQEGRPQHPQPIDGWMVWGQVINEGPGEVRNVCVKVWDEDFSDDDPIGTTYPNEYGYFAETYGKEDFGDPVSGNPDLYVTAEYPEGNVIYNSRRVEGVRRQAGPIEYFSIPLSMRLPEEPRQRRPPRLGRRQDLRELPSKVEALYRRVDELQSIRWWDKAIVVLLIIVLLIVAWQLTLVYL